MSKLVRNGPGFRIRAEGGHVRVADSHEMTRLLARKLVEEAEEIVACIDRDHLAGAVEELGDLTEVIRALRGQLAIRKDDIRAARRMKRTREGDFSERLVWENRR